MTSAVVDGRLGRRAHAPSKKRVLHGNKYPVRSACTTSSRLILLPTLHGLCSHPAAMAHRILVADDDADTLDGLTTLLTGWGYETEQARDGEEAFQRALAFRPHLAIAALVRAGSAR